MAKKQPIVCYYLKKPSHIRCVQTIPYCKNIKQIIIGPYYERFDGLYNHYIDTNIKDIITTSSNSLSMNIINNIKPNVLVVDSFMRARKIFKSINNIIFIAHGERYPVSQEEIRNISPTKHVFNSFDAYCVGSNFSKDFFNNTIGIPSEKIISNAMPQLDILLQENIIKQSIPNCTNGPKILLMGHIGVSKKHFADDDIKDFIDAAFYLGAEANRGKFQLLIRPRLPLKTIKSILLDRKESFGPKYTVFLDKLNSLSSSKNIKFIENIGHIYKFFAVDAIVGNGISTVEIESVFANIPYVKIMFRRHEDHFDTAKKDAVLVAKNTDELSCTINNILGSTDSVQSQVNRDKYLNEIGLQQDGMAGKRVLQVVRDML